MTDLLPLDWELCEGRVWCCLGYAVSPALSRLGEEQTKNLTHWLDKAAPQSPLDWNQECRPAHRPGLKWMSSYSTASVSTPSSLPHFPPRDLVPCLTLTNSCSDLVLWMDRKGQGPENHFKNEPVGFKLRAPVLRGHPQHQKRGQAQESLSKCLMNE